MLGVLRGREIPRFATTESVARATDSLSADNSSRPGIPPFDDSDPAVGAKDSASGPATRGCVTIAGSMQRFGRSRT